MANLSTTIEWTDATWSPVTGCSKVSKGCQFCYAERVFPRAYAGQTVTCQACDGTGFVSRSHLDSGWSYDDGRHYCKDCDGKGSRPRKFTDVQCHPERLDQPLKWRKPRKIFVNSMSDLFHDDVPDDFIAQVFAIMALAPQHTFQCLTKRPERMRALLTDPAAIGGYGFRNAVYDQALVIGKKNACWNPTQWPLPNVWLLDPTQWPLPNVWLLVSVEDQATADQRIPLLLDTPAALRGVSYEPALGLVDFRPWLYHPVHETRGISSSRGGVRRDSDRRTGSDLAGIGEKIRPLDRHDTSDPMQATTCREQDGSWISTSAGDDRRCASPRHGSSTGLVPPPRSDTGWHDGKPHEWIQSGQPAAEPRIGHADRSDEARPRSSEEARDFVSEGRAESPSKADGRGSRGDSRSPFERRAAQGDSEGSRSFDADGLEDIQGRTPGISWLIVGGESGPKARPFDIQWARDTIEQCRAASVPAFCKQLGSAPFQSGSDFPLEDWPTASVRANEDRTGWEVHLRDRKGGDMSEWPEDLRVRETPEVQ